MTWHNFYYPNHEPNHEMDKTQCKCISKSPGKKRLILKKEKKRRSFDWINPYWPPEIEEWQQLFRGFLDESPQHVQALEPGCIQQTDQWTLASYLGTPACNRAGSHLGPTLERYLHKAAGTERICENFVRDGWDGNKSATHHRCFLRRLCVWWRQRHRLLQPDTCRHRRH